MSHGYIYLITCTAEEKSYIGQTVDYPNSTMKDAIKLRLLNHFSVARHERGRNQLSKSIIKHGEENFAIFHIATVPIDDLDYFESYYIKKYNTLSPCGYNLTTGGKKGTKYCQESKNNISMGQFGNKRKPPKRPDHNGVILPTNIIWVRDEDKILIGYEVSRFNVGVLETIETTPKKFETKKLSLDEKLLLAKKYLTDIREKYSDNIKENEKRREGKNDRKMDEIIIKLPDDIEEIYNKDNKLIGYKVKNDTKIFCKYKNPIQCYNLKDALIRKHMIEANERNNSYIPEIDPDDEKDTTERDGVFLHNHIFHEKDTNGNKTGFYLRYIFKCPDGSTKTIRKKFCEKKEYPDVKYKKCKAYLDKLKNGINPADEPTKNDTNSSNEPIKNDPKPTDKLKENDTNLLLTEDELKDMDILDELLENEINFSNKSKIPAKKLVKKKRK
jgi:hypothetical protein